MADGDILASFRHFSSVYKIAWSDHDGFERGDVVWRLGGRHSDFAFADDPYGTGPVRPAHGHPAAERAHPDLRQRLGARWSTTRPTAWTRRTRTGRPVNRPQTRVTEYALDEDAGTATLAWTLRGAGLVRLLRRLRPAARRRQHADRLGAEQQAARHRGGSRRAPWSGSCKSDDGYLSYRAVKAVVPDAIRPHGRGRPARPTARRTPSGPWCRPTSGAVTAAARACRPATAPQALDTATAGEHTWTVTATDGAGNITTVERSYTVVAPAAYRPDAMIKSPGDVLDRQQRLRRLPEAADLPDRWRGRVRSARRWCGCRARRTAPSGCW